MRLIGILLGTSLVIVGVPLTFTPIPLGLLLVALGVVVLVASSPFVARRLKAWRAASDTVDQIVERAEDVLPDPLAEPLERTDPEADPEPGAPPVRRMEPGETWRTV